MPLSKPRIPHLAQLPARCRTAAPRRPPLAAWFEALKGSCDGISMVDAPPLAVCHNRRITRPRVFRDIAARGKTSRGWFYGFKLHTVINSRG